jgi:hypothetical protein
VRVQWQMRNINKWILLINPMRETCSLWKQEETECFIIRWAMPETSRWEVTTLILSRSDVSGRYTMKIRISVWFVFRGYIYNSKSDVPIEFRRNHTINYFIRRQKQCVISSFTRTEQNRCTIAYYGCCTKYAHLLHSPRDSGPQLNCCLP